MKQTGSLLLACFDFAEEPRARVGPVILDGALGEAQGLRGFNLGQAREITQFNHLGLNGVGGGEVVQHLVRPRCGGLQRLVG